MLEVKMGVPVPGPKPGPGPQTELTKAIKSLPVGGMIEVPPDLFPSGNARRVSMAVGSSCRRAGYKCVTRQLSNGNVGVWRVALPSP